jgi:hypothetical protein
VSRIVKATLWTFLVVVALNAVLALAGIAWVWIGQSGTAPARDLPYLRWLVSSVVAEIVAVVVLLARRGLSYMPHVETHREEAATLRFMHGLIQKGSTITIVSNRASWLARAPDVLDTIAQKARDGILVEVIVSHIESEELRKRLSEAGVALHETNRPPPEARFTLVNGNRTGAEILAIARGTHPDHEVTVFDSASGPQIIGMAKDIVRSLKSIRTADAS